MKNHKFWAFWKVRSDEFAQSRRYKILLLVSISVLALVECLPPFNSFDISPDSKAFAKPYWQGSIRPPGYYTFMWAVTGKRPPVFHSTKGEDEYFEYFDREHAYFLTVARAQKIFLAASWVFCCSMMMLAFSPTLVAALFLGLIAPSVFNQGYLPQTVIHTALAGLIFTSLAASYKHGLKHTLLCSLCIVPLGYALFFIITCFGFISPEKNLIMSEPLTQSLLMIVIGLSVAFYSLKKMWLLPLTALFCGLIYQTRPPAVFCSVIVLAMVIKAIFYEQKRNILWPFAALFVILAVYAAPAVSLRVMHKKASSTLSWAKIMFALQLAEPSDAAYIESEEGKRFFRNALVEKVQQEKELYPKKDLRYAHEFFYLNFWRVSLKLARASFGTDKNKIDEIFSHVGNAVLLHRLPQYFDVVVENYMFAMNTITRLNYPISVWLLLLLSLVLMVWLKGDRVFLAGSFILAHLTHLAVITMFEMPAPRYVQSSEVLVVISVFILLTGAVKKVYPEKGRSE